MMGFLLRWAVAFGLLAATYNPTEWNFLRWARENWETELPLTALFALILMIGYIIYLRATLRSIGLYGMVLILATAAAVLWVLYDYGWINFDNPNQNAWLGLALVSLMLAIGLSWSIVRRRLTGQIDVDDVDE